MKDYNLKIEIGDHLAKSHVYINGQEIPVTELTIKLGGGDSRPRIELGLLPYKSFVEGELSLQAEPDAAEILEALIIEGGKVYKK